MTSDLQVSLLVLGALAVAGVFAYNKWQERQARRTAEEAFRSDHTDVLLDSQPSPKPDERLEPVLDPVEERLDEVLTDPAASPLPRFEPVEAPSSLPEPPLPVVDPAIDCIVRLEAAEAVAAPTLWQAQLELWRQLTKPILWLGLNELRGQWDMLSRHSAGTYRRLCVAIQLADRRGPLSEVELSLFIDGLRHLSDRFLAVHDSPDAVTVLGRAKDLDAFCAGVDVQIGINIVSTDAAGFAGTKLRGVAEAAGFALRDDGAFHLVDEGGQSHFTLNNLEPALFTAEDMRSLTTHGITLSLDVPRVANGSTAFNRMILTANKMAAGLHGMIVDDNRAALSEQALQVIRAKIAEFQHSMEQRGIVAGGVLASRLFQ
jgi:hypothetical protein